MELKEIIEAANTDLQEGQYFVTITKNNIDVQDYDKVKSYVVALEQKIAHASGWMFWVVICIVAGLIGVANTGEALIVLQGWGPGIALVALGIFSFTVLPNVLNKKRAILFAEEFKEKLNKFGIEADSLLAEEWVDKKAFNVKNMILNGTFK